MAAQVDALAQCPPETFRSSTPTVHGAGLVRRTTSLPFTEGDIHAWAYPAQKRPTEATLASVPSLPTATNTQHRNTPDSVPGSASLAYWTNAPATTAAAAAGMAAMPGPSGHKVSADVPSETAPRLAVPQDPTSSHSLQSSAATPKDVAVAPALLPRTSLKRRRAVSDVDGTDTGSRSRKKRRLRRFLITSRLSQPFSLPASHILNRESLAMGDKRFLKLAAIINARRILPLLAPPPSVTAAASPHVPGHSATLPAAAHHSTPTGTLLHRAAMANRLRKRLFEEVAATGRPIQTRGVPAQLMASVRFSAVPAGGTGAGAVGRAAAVYPATAAIASLHPPRVPVGLRSAVLRPLAHPTVARTGLVTGLVPAPIAVRISPRLRPVLDVTPIPSLWLHKDAEEQEYDSRNVHSNDDDGDDDSCESERYDYGASDDPDDVYADFSVLFGGGSDDEWDEEGIDDIMDELDGIAHLPKQGVS